MQAVMKEEFLEWIALPVTKALFKNLKAEREEMKENLVKGIYEGQEDKVKGLCMSISNLLDIQYEDIVGGYASVK